MLTDSYRVRLEAFEGPLDLLLYLIRKSEVDIHDIPVATITEQYLSFLSDLETGGTARIDIDVAGEFLLMAATLMELKSRMLMPGAAGRPGAEPGSPDRSAQEDPRAELVRQLIEYKKYRDAADSLDHRADEWRRRFPASRVGIDDAALQAAVESASDVELEDLDILDLVESFQRIADTVNFERLGDHQVTYDDTPIELHAADIMSRLAAEATVPEVELASLFKGRTRPEMVGLFLALLELVRGRRVAVRQDRLEGQIYLRAREAEEGQGSIGQASPRLLPNSAPDSANPAT